MIGFARMLRTLLVLEAVGFTAHPGRPAADPTGDRSAATTTRGNHQMSKLHQSRPVPYTHVLRVTFAYDGDDLRIAGVMRVDMRVPAPVTPPPQEGQSGYWLEVRGGNGEVLYHFPLHDPLRRDVEIFGDEPGQPIRRAPAKPHSGTFEVLVPDLPGAKDFVLQGPHPSEKMLAAPSKPLAEHGMEALRAMAARRATGAGDAP